MVLLNYYLEIVIHLLRMVMVEMLEVFWASPIELRIIILGVLTAFVLIAYFGIKGTDEAIDFQNRLWEEKEWKRRNNIK